MPRKLGLLAVTRSGIPRPYWMNPHAPQPTSLHALASGLWGHRQLIFQMTRREVLGRYKGSFMGLAWSFFTPLLMLAVYTFIFRWSSRRAGATAEKKATPALPW
jgi:lipopolysaccharide transport system permease protein